LTHAADGPLVAAADLVNLRLGRRSARAPGNSARQRINPSALNLPGRRSGSLLDLRLDTGSGLSSRWSYWRGGVGLGET